MEKAKAKPVTKNEVNGEQKPRLLTKEFYVRHFTAIMGLLALIGALIIVFGTMLANNLLTSIGTTLFSASTLGAIFKVLGYDVYLLTVMREIIYERKFLDRLTRNELRTVIRRTVESLRQRKLADDVYGVFEQYLVDELAGLSKNQCMFKVDLDYDNSLGIKFVVGRSLLYYEVLNESKEKKPLFFIEGEADLVSRGTVTVPTQLKPSQIPNDPSVFWNLDTENGTGLRISKKDVIPDTRINWKDERNHAKGVKYEVKYADEITKDQRKDFQLKTKSLFCTHDYIVKRFAGYSRDFTILVTKPEDLEVYVVWFLTATGSDKEAIQ
ncbi:hypothetical protein MUP77_00145, partial [Candidatus Bathyarchaeota archaeon]|nr:hypothetical protein [Candidatus Bathyarchaeota archaeon]